MNLLKCVWLLKIDFAVFATVPTNFVGSFTAEDNYVYMLFGEIAVEERSKVCIFYNTIVRVYI